MEEAISSLFFLTSNPGTVVSIFIMDLPQRACDKL